MSSDVVPLAFLTFLTRNILFVGAKRSRSRICHVTKTNLCKICIFYTITANQCSRLIYVNCKRIRRRKNHSCNPFSILSFIPEKQFIQHSSSYLESIIFLTINHTISVVIFAPLSCIANHHLLYEIYFLKYFVYISSLPRRYSIFQISTPFKSRFSWNIFSPNLVYPALFPEKSGCIAVFQSPNVQLEDSSGV